MNKGCPKIQGDQQGFTLIQVLITLAILGLSSMLYFQAHSRTQKAGKILDSTKTIKDMNSILTVELGSIIRKVNASSPGCLDIAATVSNLPLAKTSGNSTLNQSQDPLATTWYPASLTTTEKAKLLQEAKASAMMQDAATRCRATQRPANAKSNAQNTFYFCMNVNQDTSAPPQSFLNSPLAFVEVGWQLINLHTGANMSCEDFVLGDRAAGAQVYYSVYWAIPVSGSYSFKKYVNSFTLGK